MNNIKKKNGISINVMMYLQRENEGEWCNYEQSYPSPLQGLPSLPKSFGGVKMVEEGVGVLF